MPTRGLRCRMVTIRLATRGATSVGWRRPRRRAFADDPLMRWLFPDDDEYSELNPQMIAYLCRRWQATESQWCTDDGVALRRMGATRAAGGRRRGDRPIVHPGVATAPSSRRCASPFGRAHADRAALVPEHARHPSRLAAPGAGRGADGRGVRGSPTSRVCRATSRPRRRPTSPTTGTTGSRCASEWDVQHASNRSRPAHVGDAGDTRSRVDGHAHTLRHSPMPSIRVTTVWPRSQEHLRIAGVADAARRAGDDQVARARA